MTATVPAFEVFRSPARSGRRAFFAGAGLRPAARLFLAMVTMALSLLAADTAQSQSSRITEVTKFEVRMSGQVRRTIPAKLLGSYSTDSDDYTCRGGAVGSRVGLIILRS